MANFQKLSKLLLHVSSVGASEGSREDEQWPRLAIGFFACRVMRTPSGGKTKSISTIVSPAPRNHSSLLIYIDRLGALVFGGLYPTAANRSPGSGFCRGLLAFHSFGVYDCPGAIFISFRRTFIDRQRLMLPQNASGIEMTMF